MTVREGAGGRATRSAAGIAGLVAACALPVVYYRWIRPRLLTWGATADEASRSYPGDDLFPDGESSSTMATTLPAPPERVWPWLVQMGGDRAGFYSWDKLDHHGQPSADRIVPEWQELHEGQRLNTEPTGRNWMTAEVVDPSHALVLRMNSELPSGRSFDPRSGPRSRVYMDGIWGFYLQPAADGQTRLVVHTRGKSRPKPLMRALDLLAGEPAHFIMQTRQFRNLRTRVGSSS